MCVIFVCLTFPLLGPSYTFCHHSNTQESMNHMTLVTIRKRGYHIDFSLALLFYLLVRFGLHFFCFCNFANTSHVASALRVKLRKTVWYVGVVVLFSGSLIEKFYGTPIYLRPFPILLVFTYTNPFYDK